MKAMLVAALAALAAGAAAAAPMMDYPDVDDTSYVEPGGNRAIQLTVELPGSPEAVWRMISTAEGWKAFAAPHAWMELRTGGMIETSYSPKSSQGGAGNIKNRIEGYVPGRLLVIRNVQAPPGFAHAQEFSQTLTFLEVRPLSPGATALTITAVGYRPGPAFDDLYAKFREGDAWTLAELKKNFTKGGVTQ